MGDSKAIKGHSDDDDSQISEELTITSTDGPENETQHNVNVQKKCKRKKPFVLFTWVEEKVKKRKEKEIIKVRERRDKELLLERYMNEHLWINKASTTATTNPPNADHGPPSPLTCVNKKKVCKLKVEGSMTLPD